LGNRKPATLAKDISFGEDEAKIRNQNAIINLHQVRKWGLLSLKKISIKRKRKKAHRDNHYLRTILK